MASDMSFWSVAVKGGSSETQDIEQSADIATYLHLTNVALGANPPDGPHTVSVIVNGEECVLATLQKNGALQHHLDVLMDEQVTFKNSGKGPVHISGYLTFSRAEDYDEDDEDDEDEEDEDEDDEEAPNAVPLHNGKAKARRPVLMDEDDDEDEEGEDDEDEDEDEDEEDENPKASKRLLKALDADRDEEGDDFEIHSDDIVGEFDDEDDEGEDDDEDEGEDEDEDEEEEEEEQPKGKPQAGAKRVIPAATTPAPKKAKVEEAKVKAPASAPPKMQKPAAQGGEKKPAAAQAGEKKPAAAQSGAVAPDNAKLYEQNLNDFLARQVNKTATLAQIGSNVKRPPSVPKLSAFVKSKSALYKHDEKGGTVTLLK